MPNASSAKLDRIGAEAAADCVPRAAIIREVALEALDIVAQDEALRFDDALATHHFVTDPDRIGDEGRAAEMARVVVSEAIVLSVYGTREALWHYECDMKGIVLMPAARVAAACPLTKITNKHLLPIYDKPMIYYPIQTLVDAGIDDIMIVTGGRSSGDFLRLLANGKEFGLSHINYTYQEGEGGTSPTRSAWRRTSRRDVKST